MPNWMLWLLFAGLAAWFVYCDARSKQENDDDRLDH